MQDLTVKSLKPDARVRQLVCLLSLGVLLSQPPVSAVEDPFGCSLANGGSGNTSQGGINFNLPQAHVGDTVGVFPSLGMVGTGCRAVNATGEVYIATGPLTNFLVNVTLDPGNLIVCPRDGLCQPGPYNILITPALVGAPVNTPLGGAPGLAKNVRAAENGFGTVLAGFFNEQLSDFHTASIRIVTPAIQVFKTCDLPAGQTCFPYGAPINFRGYVTNAGDITLTNVIVVDSRMGPVQLFNPTNGLAFPNNVILPPGAIAVFSNSFLPTLAETCAGSAASLVTATARDTTIIGGPNAAVTNSLTSACAICPAQPGLVVTKTCPPGAVAPGGVLPFTGTLTNTGNIPLTNVTVVTDRLLTAGGTLLANIPLLTNGEFRSFSGSYLVPTNGCSLTDTLTAQGQTLCGIPVTGSVTRACAVTNTPRLALTRTCPAVAPAPGQLLVFGGTVTNTGDVAVTNLVILNSLPTNNTPVTVVARLEPGQGVSYSGSYLVPANVCSLTDTVTASGLDACGTPVTATVTRTCAVADVQNPVITCPPDIIVPANSGCSATNVDLGTPVTSDNCGVASVRNDAPSALSPAGSAAFPITSLRRLGGDVIVTWSSQAGQTYRLLYKDNLLATDWSAVPGDVTAVGSSTSKTNVVGAVAQRCYRVQLLSGNAGGSFHVGTNLVTWTVTDTSGNISTCVQQVIVRDIQNPVINCPTNLVLTTDPGQCSRSNVTFTVGWADNCGVTNVVSSMASGSTFPVGTTTVTNTVTDASGNTTTCTFTVTVTDTQNPVIICPGNLVLAADPGGCSRSNVTFVVQVTDDCSVTNLVSLPPSGSTFPFGTTTVTNIATDASGNRSTCSFTVTVTNTPQLAVTRQCPAVPVAPGGLTVISGVVSNAGTMTLTNVVVVNTEPTNQTRLLGPITLTPGQAASFTGSYRVPANSCAYSDTVTATGTGLCNGSNVVATATALCPTVTIPRLAVTARCPTVPVVPGELATISGVVSNAGNIALTNVVVVDEAAANNPLLLGPITLAPGKTASFTGNYSVPLNSCSYSDTVTATGVSLCTGENVAATATALCLTATDPQLTVTKNCPALPVPLGQRLVFSGVVSNAGNITLIDVVVVNDQPSNNTVVLGPIDLAPGEAVSYTGAYLVPLDICATNFLDTVTARGVSVCKGKSVSASRSTLCPIAPVPRLVVTKQCPANPVPPGGWLVFSGTVSNAGNITLTNVLVVNDQPSNNTPVFGPLTLAPNQATNFSGSYRVCLDCCPPYVDTLTVSGAQICNGSNVTATATANCAGLTTPQIRLTVECPPAPARQGQLLFYSGSVSNSGDFAVSDVRITDDKAGFVAQFALLAPAETADFFGTYVATNCGPNVLTLVTATAVDVCTGARISHQVSASCPILCPTVSGRGLNEPPANPAPRLLNPGIVGGQFQFTLVTEPGRAYTVEYTEAARPLAWQALTQFQGDGGSVTIRDPAAHQQRFYRVRVQ